MFGRQWFPHSSQEGLSTDALAFETLLENSRTQSAKLLIASKIDRGSAYWVRQSTRLRHLQFIKKNRLNNQLKLYFSSFWPTLDIYHNQFIDIFRRCTSNVIRVVTDPRDCDIALYSCYGNMSDIELTSHAFRVLFLGENVRPSFSEFDLSLSFDQSSYSGRNIYLPLWLLELNLFNTTYPDRCPIDIQRIVSPLSRGSQPRKKRVVYVGNNCEPLRINFINLLRANNIPVDVFGQHTNPISDKLDVYSQYELALCPENSYYPGYCTEKLIHSFSSGCFSLYWGGTEQLPFHTHPSIIRIATGAEIDSINIVKQLLFSKSPSFFSKLMSESALCNFYNDSLSSLSRKLKIYDRR